MKTLGGIIEHITGNKQEKTWEQKIQEIQEKADEKHNAEWEYEMCKNQSLINAVISEMEQKQKKEQETIQLMKQIRDDLQQKRKKHEVK